jgi:hypothetical protein
VVVRQVTTHASRATFKHRDNAPYDFRGPFSDGQVFGSGGIIKALPSNVGNGGTVTIAHGLGRVPVYVTVLVNGAPGYPSRVFLASATSASANVTFESATNASGTFLAFS